MNKNSIVKMKNTKKYCSMDVRLYSTNQSNKKRELKRGKSVPPNQIIAVFSFCTARQEQLD
jgi:hypothetical protein